MQKQKYSRRRFSPHFDLGCPSQIFAQPSVRFRRIIENFSFGRRSSQFRPMSSMLGRRNVRDVVSLHRIHTRFLFCFTKRETRFSLKNVENRSVPRLGWSSPSPSLGLPRSGVFSNTGASTTRPATYRPAGNYRRLAPLIGISVSFSRFSRVRARRNPRAPRGDCEKGKGEKKFLF